MLTIILFCICMLASSVGAIVGAGGGVIIKPVLDMLGILPVSTVSFCSGCTVLGMSLSSLLRARGSGQKIQVRTSTALAIGAVFGGLIGQSLFEMVRTGFEDERVLGATQAILLTLMTVGVFFYVCKKDSLPSKHVTNFFASALIGVALGVISSFLGIGGGPCNVAVLFFFFSMNAKEAALNSLYIIIFSQISSTTTAIVSGNVPEFAWINLIGMIAGGIVGALIGAAVSKRINNQGVEKILKGFLLVIIGINIYNVLKYTIL